VVTLDGSAADVGLLAANARLDQSAAVAQTSGPMVGGALVTLLGAPVVVLVDSLSYLVSGVLTASVLVQETVADAGCRETSDARSGTACGGSTGTAS